MNAPKARLALTGLGLATLLCALLLPDGPVSGGLLLVCVALSLVILWRHLPQLSDLEEGHPKVDVLRRATLFTVFVLAILLAAVWALESGRWTPTPNQTKWAMAVFFAVLILGFGNLAPMLPCTRHTGLRLPWTVRDEQTWLVAHRMLGWLCLPFGALCLAAGAIPRPETAIKALVAVLLAWAAIPSVLSLVFYLRKYGRL